MHHSVLPKEVLQYLDINSSDTVVDGTLGGGGHAQLISRLLGPKGHLIGLDLDPDALVTGRQQLLSALCQVTLIQENFKHLPQILADQQLGLVDKVLLDLGWSSNQFNDPHRGFSFQLDGPLAMRLDQAAPSKSLQAATIVNEWTLEQLTTIINAYGEERFARPIAKALISARELRPIETTTQLADIISGAVPRWYRHGRIHPATKTFQALRITVNDELETLEQFLEAIPMMMAPGGRIVIISFHSHEDRRVKRAFRNLATSSEWEILTKKPVTAGPEELSENPRARSAKLRSIRRIQ